MDFLILFTIGALIYLATLLIEKREPHDFNRIYLCIVDLQNELCDQWECAHPKFCIESYSSIYKGHYDVDKKEITIYLAKHTNMIDVMETLVHELWHHLQFTKQMMDFDEYDLNPDIAEREADSIVLKTLAPMIDKIPNYHLRPIAA